MLMAFPCIIIIQYFVLWSLQNGNMSLTFVSKN